MGIGAIVVTDEMCYGAVVYEIYCHTHVASQKRYVGQTKNGWERRWRGHVREAMTGKAFCRLFARAIRAHGEDAFTHEVLETCDTLEAANEAEIWWIAHFGCDDRVLGYNLDVGGKSHNSSEESKAKIGAAVKACWAAMSDEERAERSRRAAAAALAAFPLEKRAATLQQYRGNASAEELADNARRAAATKLANLTPERAAARSNSARQMRAAYEARTTPEQRASANRERIARIPPEQRSVRAKQAAATRIARGYKTFAQRSEESQRAHIAAIAAGRNAHAASLTPEEKREQCAKGHAARKAQREAGAPPTARSLKAREKRRADKAARAAASSPMPALPQPTVASPMPSPTIDAAPLTPPEQLPLFPGA